MMTKSEQMSRVRTRDTAAEMILRRALSARGVRYRLHRRDLPGKPDLYIARLHLAIFVNGCFWHGHSCRRGALPSSNRDFWENKIGRNRCRDADVLARLAEREIAVITIWECELKHCDAVADEVAVRYRRSH
jgi:DNA mismatch endonuclease (patch repair protein)